VFTADGRQTPPLPQSSSWQQTSMHFLVSGSQNADWQSKFDAQVVPTGVPIEGTGKHHLS
jgi:hypothetical protein